MPSPSPTGRHAVLSTQVSSSRYFFLGLGEPSGGGVVPAYGGFERCDPDYLVQRDQIEFTTLELVISGEGTVTLAGAAAPLRAGTVFHYDRTTPLEIRTDPRRPMAKYFLCLAGARAARRVRAAGLAPAAVRQVAMFPEVQAIFDDLIREGQHHRATAGRICAALVEVLLLKLEELCSLAGRGGTSGEETFLRCKGVIEARAAELATLGDITRAVGLETSHLSRLFRRYQGISPYQFLLRRKMTLAAELLLDPRALVKTVAAQVGFRDPYHFSRCFKAVHRVAPRDLQHALQQR